LLALVLIRVAEHYTRATWPVIARELDRIHAIDLAAHPRHRASPPAPQPRPQERIDTHPKPAKTAILIAPQRRSAIH
jgi:hypothetical protein